MSDFLSQLKASNDKLGLLKPLADSAAKHERHADTSKGSAGILCLYMIAAGIRTGAFHFPNSSNPQLSTTINPDHARGIARLWFGRYDNLCQDNATLKARGEIITRKDSEQGANGYIRDMAAMLYPYTCMGVTYDMAYKSSNSKIYPWQVTRGNLVGLLDKALTKGNIKRAAYDTELKALDAVDVARSMARRYVPLACLYLCLDTTGERIAASDMDKLHLSCLKSWFMAEDMELIMKDAPCVIKPARGEAVTLYYASPNDETGSDGGSKPKSVNASIDQFTKAWTVNKPKPKAEDATDVLAALNVIAASDINDRELTRDERTAFDAAYNVMLKLRETHDKVTKRNKSKPETQEDTRTAHEIAEALKSA